MIQYPLLGAVTRTWTVSEVNRYLRETIEGDYRLQDLWVAGEVSNLSRPASGHLYFTIKDSTGTLGCVMWKPNVLRQWPLPENGQAVEVHGKLSVYEAGGRYQLYADEIHAVGAGTLYQDFEALKRRLEGEGLFDPARKRSLPSWPRRIGLVTSPAGAALRDILKTLRRRFPLAEVVLSPTPVQGEEAPARIVAALQALNHVSHPEVILLARGGGSLEDLWAFNDERVARAIAASKAPVVTGVGHETDFTIADFVADLRAPTPTAAAVLATPDLAEVRSRFSSLLAALAESLAALVRESRWGLAAQVARLRGLSPAARLLSFRQRVDELGLRTAAEIKHSLRLRRERLNGLVQRMQGVSPAGVLARGYALVTEAKTGRVVRSAAQVGPGDRVEVRVSDGAFGAEVTETSNVKRDA